MAIQSKYINLSYKLELNTPQSKEFPQVKCEHYWDVSKGKRANVFVLTMTSHSGTHVDAPYHVDPEGLRISDFDISELIFQMPLCIDIEVTKKQLIQPAIFQPYIQNISGCDLLLIRTYFSRFRTRNPNIYWQQSPGFSVDCAKFFRKVFPNLRAIGLDLPSIICISKKHNTMKAHNELLCGKGRRFLIIEDMFMEVDLSHLKQIIVAPLMIEKADSAPCTVIGINR